MIADAERYKEEDERAAARIKAKNSLEQYAFTLRTTVTDPKIEGKLDASDKATIEEAVKETLAWLDDHPNADQTDYENKQQDLEKKCMPIMSKLYAAGGAGAGAGAGFPDMDEAPAASAPRAGPTSGPKVEEVD